MTAACALRGRCDDNLAWWWVALGGIAVGVAIGVAVMRSRAHSASPRAANAPSPVSHSRAPLKSKARENYSPDHVGNDASARPWERNSLAFRISQVGAVPTGVASPLIATARSWDRTALVGAARAQFDAFHEAVARQDWAAVDRLTDPALASQLRTRAQAIAHESRAHALEEHVVLDTRVLEVAEVMAGQDADAQPAHWRAAVEFSGMRRSADSGSLHPFREVWTFEQPLGTPPRDAMIAWRIAGLEALS
jgi:predicted lipid-binding transport protein (Tim44 family)